MSKSVVSAARTANDQIRSTKGALDAPSLKGCLVIVCPTHALTLEIQRWAVADMKINGKLPDVQTVIFAHSPLLAPFESATLDSLMCFTDTTESKMQRALKERIGIKWAEAHDQEIGPERPPETKPTWFLNMD